MNGTLLKLSYWSKPLPLSCQIAFVSVMSALEPQIICNQNVLLENQIN